MFLKRRARRKEQSGVQYINGIVSVGPVRLNVHAFYTDGMLIDTGSPSLFTQFKPFLDDVPAEKVVLTHHHEDHAGGAAYMQEAYDLPIKMHPLYIEQCQRRATYPFYRRAFWGTRRPFQAEAIGQTVESNTSTWQVIDTPGHAADHVAFINQQTGQLFSGDLYVHPETKLILRNESIPQIIDSLTTLLTYDFEEMFCCHAGYVADGRKALQEKLEYLTMLRERVVDLAKEGLPEKEIHQRLFPKRYPITLLSFGEWHSKHIVRSILQER